MQDYIVRQHYEPDFDCVSGRGNTLKIQFLLFVSMLAVS